jgi:hypothetical protein
MVGKTAEGDGVLPGVSVISAQYPIRHEFTIVVRLNIKNIVLDHIEMRFCLDP